MKSPFSFINHLFKKQDNSEKNENEYNILEYIEVIF